VRGTQGRFQDHSQQPAGVGNAPFPGEMNGSVSRAQSREEGMNPLMRTELPGPNHFLKFPLPPNTVALEPVSNT
jgi:hypothetical protein